MRKLVFCLFSMAFIFTAYAQTPETDSLKEYTGKYKFPEGSPIMEVTLTIENGILFGSSAMGSSELKRIEKDIFEIVSYAGRATFKRDDQSKINKVIMEVENMILEGTKSEAALLPDRSYYPWLNLPFVQFK